MEHISTALDRIEHRIQARHAANMAAAHRTWANKNRAMANHYAISGAHQQCAAATLSALDDDDAAKQWADIADRHYSAVFYLETFGLDDTIALDTASLVLSW